MINPNNPSTKLDSSETRQIILDTDIGTDVDDAMALSVVLGSANLRLLAASTVYGDTTLRAQLASRYAALAGRRIRAVAGSRETLSGREVWWPGHEGSLHENLTSEVIDAEPAVEVLTRLIISEYDKNTKGGLPKAETGVDLIAIAPLTNIAQLFLARPDIPTKLRHLWVMGGAFDNREATEHNFLSDAKAAKVVLSSQAQITIVGLDVTERLRIVPEQIAHLDDYGPLGKALHDDIRQWRAMWGESWNVPHDPLTVLALTNPELFDFSAQGTVSINDDENSAKVGESVFTPDPSGNIRLVTGMRQAKVAELMIRRIELAAQGAPTR